ncbi:MAG TPA: divergent polysaccharide deacetylase family protein [Thermoanaerobaculia bacterium]|nr:divergent polysaccharide deacetylase family protein [Thermoanaerobaculia bacterium]
MSRRGRRPSPATVFFALLSLALGIALFVKTRPPVPPAPVPREPLRPSPTRGRPLVPATPKRPAPAPAGKPVPTAPAGSGTPRVAIVIDDLGNELAPAARIAGWKAPVAGAVLPDLRWSAASAEALARGGHEVLLHLPMEPTGYPRVRPGPGLVLRSQSDAEIERLLEEDLATVPGAVGVNNHMGSAATADARVMRAVSRVLSRRGLFFLDSRTTDATVAEKTAEENSVRAASRRVFLDDVASDEAIRRQLDELVRRAEQEGFAIAIGHPYPVTLFVLERELPGLSERGVRLVKVSELVR